MRFSTNNSFTIHANNRWPLFTSLGISHIRLAIDLLRMNKTEYLSGKRKCSHFKFIFSILLEKQGELYNPPANIADLWIRIQICEYHYSAVTFGNTYYRLYISTTPLSILHEHKKHFDFVWNPMATEYLHPLKARWLETDCIWFSRVFPFELRDSRQSASKWVILMDPAYINGLFVYPGAAVKRTPTWYFHLYTEPTCSLHIAQFKLPPLLQSWTMNASDCIVKVFQIESQTRHRPPWDFFFPAYSQILQPNVWTVPQITPRTTVFSIHY